MLKLSAIADREILDGLHREIFGGVYPKDIGYVLYEGETPIGLAQMTVTDKVSRLEKVGIVPSYRGKRNGDFFARSLIWGLSQASETVEICCKNKYYEKFGFAENGDIMICKGKDVVFPCECHH